MSTTPRFYRKTLPKVDSFVMALITSVTSEGATCQLLEYGSIPAYMPVTQFTSKWIKSIRQVAKAGSIEILQVLSVNKDTKTIDLSKKQLTEKDIQVSEEYYRKSKRYNSLIQRLSDVSNESVEQI